MEWVTYLSPSGGAARLGALDDGDVLGCPVTDDLAALLDAGAEAMARARARAVDDPVEIIFEPEARMCAPLVPDDPVRVRFGDTGTEISPDLVRGVDDGVVAAARTARVGLAAISGAEGPATAFTMACLWLDGSGTPLQLTLGPNLVSRDEVMDDGAGVAQEFSAFVDDESRGRAAAWPEDAWFASVPGRLRALLCLDTGPLEPDDELNVQTGALGGFELRVGSLV